MVVSTPSILGLLNKYNVTYTEEKQGQVRISCPSKKTDDEVCVVNLEKNVYYCQCCRSGGGLKRLESLLSNKPMKKKFGAATLTREQLAKIGWERLKDNGPDFYREHHRQVMADWNMYEFEQRSKMYAIFLVMMHLEDKDIGAKMYDFLIEMFECSTIPNLDMLVFIDALVDSEQPNAKKVAWVVNGQTIARKVIKECQQNGDKSYKNAFMLLVFDCYKNTVPYSYVLEQNLQFYSTKKFKYTHLQEIFNWEKYQYNIHVYAFAAFIILYEEKDSDKQAEIFKKLLLFLEYSMIRVNISELVEQYCEDDIYRADWAREGTRLARLAWRHAGEYPKHDFLTVLFVHIKYTSNIQKTYFEGEKAI